MRQPLLFKKSMLALCLMGISAASFADTGYIRHRIVNETPHELYVGVRQQFSYPLEGCLGPIASGATKECDGAFEKGYSKFVVEVIKNTAVAQELSGTASLPGTQLPNLFVTWTVKLDAKQELGVWFKTESTPFKMVSVLPAK